MQQAIEKYLPIIKKNILPLSLGFFGLIFLGYGLIGLIGSSDSSKSIIFEPGNDSNLSSDAPSKEDKTLKIVVDVEGAVLKPGVYTLSSNSRVSEAIIAAHGLSGNADRDWLVKNLNLAAKLTDGAKIYIPRMGEALKSAMGGTGITSTTGGESTQININTASEDLLDSLPGVGRVTAQKIINGRPYSSIDDLLSRKIVGSKVFQEIKEKISVY